MCVCVYIYIYILLHTFINLSLKSSHYLKKVDSNHPQLISVQCPPKWEDFEFMFTKSSQMCTEQRTRLWDPPTELWESEFKPSQCSQRRIRVCINIAIWIYIYICMYTHMIILTFRVKNKRNWDFFAPVTKWNKTATLWLPWSYSSYGKALKISLGITISY